MIEKNELKDMFQCLYDREFFKKYILKFPIKNFLE